MEKLQKKRGTDIPLLFVEVVRITFEEEIAVSPRVCANPYTLLPLFEIFHVSTNKTSITLRDFTMKSKCKSTKKYGMYEEMQKIFSRTNVLLLKK